MWVFVYCHLDTGLVISKSYADWSDCYEAYVEEMLRLQQDGMDLSEMSFRGVYPQG